MPSLELLVIVVIVVVVVLALSNATNSGRNSRHQLRGDFDARSGQELRPLNLPPRPVPPVPHTIETRIRIPDRYPDDYLQGRRVRPPPKPVDIEIMRSEFRAALGARRHVVIDCETTGLQPGEHRMVSFAAVEVAPPGDEAARKAVRILNLVFNPGCKNGRTALKRHGLTDKYLALQPPFADTARDLAEFLRGAVIIGHNVSFDIGFLNSEMRLAGLPALEVDTLCTMWKHRDFWPGQTATLDACAERYGIDLSGRAQFHGALIDAAITLQLFHRMCLGDAGFVAGNWSAAKPFNERAPMPTRSKRKRSEGPPPTNI
jgi:DNA polymerase-3 subunit epsilon